MNEFFVEQCIGWGLVHPGKELEGFVFSTLNEGSKQFTVKLLALTVIKNSRFLFRYLA